MHRGVRARCALLPAVGALWPLFPRAPRAERGWAMEDGNTCGLTSTEEAHRLHVHQRHFIQVQHGPGSIESGKAHAEHAQGACATTRSDAISHPPPRAL